MIKEDEYIFNNKEYEISLRNIKANFFDILNVKTDNTAKVEELKDTMQRLVELVKELDSNSEVNVKEEPKKEELRINDDKKDIEENTNESVEEKRDDISVNNTENIVNETNSIKDFNMFIKNNENQPKLILVSDEQFNKLSKSKEEMKEKILLSFDDNNDTKSLTEKAIKLYKEGKTIEAQEIMNKINLINHSN